LDFSLTEDQRLLKETLLRFLEREYDFAKRQLILEKGGFDATIWLQMADMGLLGAHFSESLGGYGGAVESMVIMEALGRHLALEPLVQCAIIAGTIIAGDSAGRLRAERLEALMSGELRASLATMEIGMRSPYEMAGVQTTALREDDGWVLKGKKLFVYDGGAATHFIVTARDPTRNIIVLFLVPADAEGLHRRSYRTLDGHTAADITLSSVAVEAAALIEAKPSGEHLVSYALDRGVAALCAEAVGSMEHLLEATSAYTRERVQYGSALANFQVLQHRMAEMFVELETARSMAYLAAFTVDADGADRVADICAARVQVGRAARFVGQEAVQLHGAMGMAEENSVAHYFSRLTQFAHLFGEESFHLRRFAACRTK
jgi:alkylation response protein AidB-like acyl-CoA dehydrogenase